MTIFDSGKVRQSDLVEMLSFLVLNAKTKLGDLKQTKDYLLLGTKHILCFVNPCVYFPALSRMEYPIPQSAGGLLSSFPASVMLNRSSR